MYNFDSPLWQNSKIPSNSNRKLKSISIQKSMNQLNDETSIDIRKKLLPLLNGPKVRKRDFNKPQSPRLLQFQSDRHLEDKLPSLNKMSLSKSQDRSSPQKSEIHQLSKRIATDVAEVNKNDRLSLKKLNELLNNHRIPKKLPPSRNHPAVSELEDLSKKMDEIYKKNNVNPLKMKATIQFYSPREKKNAVHSIDSLIKLLKS